MDRGPIGGGKSLPVLSVRPAASNPGCAGCNGKTSCGQASPWAMDGAPCCSPPGYTLVPGCCECSRHCCDNAWAGYCEHRAQVDAFWARVGVPKPRRRLIAGGGGGNHVSRVPDACRAARRGAAVGLGLRRDTVEPANQPLRPRPSCGYSRRNRRLRPRPSCRRRPRRRSRPEKRRSRCGNGDFRQYETLPQIVAVLTIFSILPIVRTITSVESLCIDFNGGEENRETDHTCWSVGGYALGQHWMRLVTGSLLLSPVRRPGRLRSGMLRRAVRRRLRADVRAEATSDPLARLCSTASRGCSDCDECGDGECGRPCRRACGRTCGPNCDSCSDSCGVPVAIPVPIRAATVATAVPGIAGRSVASSPCSRRGCWCGPNCGERYWGDFYSDPPDCEDPCDCYGNYAGGGCRSCGGGYLTVAGIRTAATIRMAADAATAAAPAARVASMPTAARSTTRQCPTKTSSRRPIAWSVRRRHPANEPHRPQGQ